MKKSFNLLTVVLLSGLVFTFLLTGCDSKTKEPTAPSKPQTTTPPLQSESPKTEEGTKPAPEVQKETTLAPSKEGQQAGQSKEESKDVIVIKNEKEFVDFLEKNPMAVVDFTATWCGPCQRLAPLLDKMATDNKDKGVHFAKVDVDLNKAIATEYKVQGIPDVRFFSGGKEFKKVVGLNPEAIQGALDSLIAFKGAAPKDYGEVNLEDELWNDKK